jgi:hypothetical protein
MNRTLLVIGCFCMKMIFACSQPAAPAIASAPSAASGFTTEGPDVDLLKKAYQAYEKGDCAVNFTNVMATDEHSPSLPVDSIIATHKFGRENLFENVSINNPIYEVVTTADGSKYGHVWTKITSKLRKTGAPMSTTVFGSYGIKDGKLTFEWLIYNPPVLQ